MAGINTITFASNAAAGTSSAFKWNGGKMTFMAEATWGGGSAKLQFENPNGTWADVANCTLSANGFLILDVPAGQVRSVTATGSGFYVWGFTYLTPMR